MSDEPSKLKYIGVYLLASISSGLITNIIMLLPTIETLLSSFGFFILASIEVAIIYYVVTFTYSKFLDLDMNKAWPWIVGLMILKYLILVSNFHQALNMLPNYTTLLIIVIIQPIVIYKILKDHFQNNGRLS